MDDQTEDELLRKMQDIDAEVANLAISYIYAQLNKNTFQGYVNDFEFRILLDTAVDGLFTLIYYTSWKDEDGLHQLGRKDQIMDLSFDLIYLLFTRVRNGTELDLEKRRIEAQRPILPMR